MDVFEQQQSLDQALGHSPPFSLCPHPYAGYYQQWLTTECVGGLPAWLLPLRGGNVRPDLYGWLGITTRCSDGNPIRGSGRSP